jgi:signal transduction histidine kinase
MRSLWVKLSGALALVTVLTVLLVALAAVLGTEQAFRLYVSQGGRQRSLQWAPVFADFYSTNGSWSGVESVFDSNPLAGRGMMGRGMGMVSQDRLIVADDRGLVVGDSSGALVGKKLSVSELAQGAPIEVAGRQVGTVVVAVDAAFEGQTPESTFLAQTQRALILGGLVAGVLALAIGFVLVRHVTAPLRSLTQAARLVAAGDFSQRVNPTSADEIGELGFAFNEMAASIQRDEQLRRNMVADIAHELRTPLTVIRGNLEGALEGVLPLSSETLLPVHQQAILLSRLVEDLRELALAESGQLVLEREPVDIRALAESVLAALRPQAAPREIDLVADIELALPVAWADPSRVRQILLNLLANALRHTPKGGRVVVSARTEGALIRIAVQDSGLGIPPEELPHVFERFYRGDPSRARETGGSGLGLAIVKHLVLLHGGEVWAVTGPPGGARLEFTLPRLDSTSQ